jgi:choloylglycine hydrolase
MCTTFRLKTTGDDVIVGRTMEFAVDLGWRLLVTPRGTACTGTAPDGPGHAWTAQHGFVGVSALGRPVVTDGINDAGLYAGLLYLPGYARYQEDEGVAASDLLSADEVATLVLASAGTVAEAVAATESVVVWNRVEEQLGGILPIHLVLHDRSGAAAVVEWVDGERRVHENPLGVCTNAPPFDWHMTNLRNFVNLSATNVAPHELDGADVRGFGEGTGLIGLPGDWTPPSRFVRATALSQAAYRADDVETAMLTALHVVNTFDIPRGLVRGEHGDEYTGWGVVADLAGGRYALRTYEDPTPRMVALADLALDGGGPVRELPLPSSGAFLPFEGAAA